MKKRGERDVYCEVVTRYQDLPCSVRAYCIHDDDGTPIIIINSRMSYAQQKQSWRHEFRHIHSGELYDTEYREYS